MKNPHIIVGQPRRCLCGTYGVTTLEGERPTSCADLLAALERLVKTKAQDAILLCEAITPLVTDCDGADFTPTGSIEAVKKLRRDLAFSESQTPPGAAGAVLTTPEAVRGALFEIEQLDSLNRQYFTKLQALGEKDK